MSGACAVPDPSAVPSVSGTLHAPASTAAPGASARSGVGEPSGAASAPGFRSAATQGGECLPRPTGAWVTASRPTYRSDSRSSRRGASSGTSPTERSGARGTSRCVVPCSPCVPGPSAVSRASSGEVCGPSGEAVPGVCPSPGVPGAEPARRPGMSNQRWEAGGVSGVRGIPSHTPPGSRTLKVNSLMCPVTGD